MGEDEVLAAGLAHQSGIIGIGRDILAHLFLDALEDPGGAGEVEPRHLGMAHHIFGHIASGAGHKVDDARGQTAPLQQFHIVIIGQYSRAGGFPQGHVAYDGRCSGKIDD